MFFTIKTRLKGSINPEAKFKVVFSSNSKFNSETFKKIFENSKKCTP